VEVREEVRQLARPLADEAGYELVDVELVPQGRRRIVRVLLDKEGGISISDCAQFSRRLADCLDMNQTIPGSYYLEVSSPGIQRPLRTLEAVERFTGQRTALTTYEAKDGRRNFDGMLLGPSEGRVGVRTDDGNEHWFEWAEVKSAHLVVDPWAALRSAANPRRDGGPR
jgi:ribosome maturation factor RimP